MKFLPYERLFQAEKADFHKALDHCIDAGQFVLGPEVEEFEKNLAEFIGTNYAVGVNSGTDALYLALRAAGIGLGDEVITVSHTFIATIEAIVRTGATPILVDIDPETGLISKFEITKKTKAIIPVHLEGKVCQFSENVQEYLKACGVVIIEDAAQALGAEHENGKKVGGLGLAGCFSFYPAKIMGTMGDAGAITTNDPEFYVKLLHLRNHYNVKQQGLSFTPPESIEWTGNSRLDNLQAAFLNIRFKNLAENLLRRKLIAIMYDEAFKGLPIKLPLQQEGRVYQDYVIRCQNRDERDRLKIFLDKKGIGTLGTDIEPNHKYKGIELNFDLPKTENYLARQMRLPCNQVMTNEEIAEVIKAITEFYA